MGQILIIVSLAFLALHPLAGYSQTALRDDLASQATANGYLHENELEIIDSIFNMNYRILSTQLDKTESGALLKMEADSLTDYLDRVEAAMHFFEKSTGIPAQQSGDYVSIRSFDRALLSRWKNWFMENRRLLHLDRFNGRIIRRPY